MQDLCIFAPTPTRALLEVLGYAVDGPHRRPRGRCAPELRQDGPGHRGAGAARRTWSSASFTPGSITTPGCRPSCWPTSSSPSPTSSSAWDPAPTARRRRALSRPSSGSCSRIAPDLVCVGGDVNSTLAVRAGGRQARDPGGARRVRPALVRLDDARGDQPRPHRPALRPPLHAQPRGRDEPRRRRHRRTPRSTSSATR